MGKYLLLGVLILVVSCSKSREIVEKESSGTVTFAVAMEGTELRSRATTFSTLRISVFNSSGSVVIDTSIDVVDGIEFVQIPAITEGQEYSAVVWTEDAVEDTIHAPLVQQFNVIASEQTLLQFELVSQCGSIMFQVVGIPTVVDSLSLLFQSDSGFFALKEERSTRQFISLDKIPYGATGTLLFEMYRDDGYIVSSWDTLFTFTKENFSARFSLINNGTIETEVSVEIPFTTIFSALGDTTTSLDSEFGDLVITEFCVTGGSGGSSAEFIEIYNSSTIEFSASELILNDGNKSHKIKDLIIPVHEYIVISTVSGTHWNPDYTVPLDFTSTSGFITITTDGTLQDYLIFFNDDNAGWDKLSSSSRTSWALQGSIDASSNNTPSNWIPTVSEVVDAESQIWKGTAGTSGI